MFGKRLDDKPCRVRGREPGSTCGEGWHSQPADTKCLAAAKHLKGQLSDGVHRVGRTLCTQPTVTACRMYRALSLDHGAPVGREAPI